MTLLLGGSRSRAVAADHVVGGTQLALRADASQTSGSLSMLLRDPAIPAPVAGSADDPSLSGVTLTVFGRGTATQASLVTRAEPGLWSIRSAVGGALTFRFRDAAASFANADLLGVVIRGGRAIRVDARTPGIALPGYVRAVAVRVAWGSTRVCTVFDVDSVRREKAGKLVARGAATPALPDCDDASLAAAATPTCDDGSCPGGCGLGTACTPVPDPVSPSCACVLSECPGGCPDGWFCAYPTTGGTCMPMFCDNDGSCSQPGTECSLVDGFPFCMTPCSGGDPHPTCGGTCPDPRTHCIAGDDRCVCG